MSTGQNRNMTTMGSACRALWEVFSVIFPNSSAAIIAHMYIRGRVSADRLKGFVNTFHIRYALSEYIRGNIDESELVERVSDNAKITKKKEDGKNGYR